MARKSPRLTPAMRALANRFNVPAHAVANPDGDGSVLQVTKAYAREIGLRQFANIPRAER